MAAEPSWKHHYICVEPWSPFKHSLLIKPFMKEVFWFERPPQAYLYWNECITGETSSSSLQKTLQGTTTIIVFLSHRKQVWHPPPPPAAQPNLPASPSEPNYRTLPDVTFHPAKFFFKTCFWSNVILPASSTWPWSVLNMGLLMSS